MKTFIDRLRDRSMQELVDLRNSQDQLIKIAQRDLATIQRVIAEKEQEASK